MLSFSPLSFVVAASVFSLVALAVWYLVGRWLFGWRECVLWVGTTGDQVGQAAAGGE